MENNFGEYKIIKKLDNGASAVEKYELEKNGKKYLLRLYNVNFMNSRIKALEHLKLLKEKGINVPGVHQYGIMTDKSKGFAILDWIDGKSLNSVLGDIKKDSKYGFLVAKELMKLHDSYIQAQDNIYENFRISLEKKYLKVLKLGINLPKLNILYNYAYDEGKILKNEKFSSIIHGDFHPGNIIIDKEEQVWLIDLDVCKRTHRWEEFSTNACNMDFPNFYSSTLINYFEGNIPLDFWRIYNLYGCIYVLDHFLYLNRMENKSINEGIIVFQKFLEYSKEFSNNEPTWFNQDTKIKSKVIK